jgi:hypothetical protein
LFFVFNDPNDPKAKNSQYLRRVALRSRQRRAVAEP